MSTDTVLSDPTISAMLSAETFEEAVSAAGGLGNVVHIGKVVGDGFSLLTDKNALVGLPLMILEWIERNDETSGRDYMSMRLLTNDGRRLVVNDGSTGIADQLRELTRAGVEHGPVYCRGLRRSDYVYENEKGEKSSATTFYFDTSV